MYRDIFNGEFNLGFAPPRTDTCATCHKLSLSIQAAVGTAEKEQKEEELKNHQEKARAGYEMKREDKQGAIRSWNEKARPIGSSGVRNRSKDAVDMITFDFQQNLPTPNLQHNDMFYKRQLWTYNFGIHDCVADQGYMFMWDETKAQRGSGEVASCLYQFLTEFNTGARYVSVISFTDLRFGKATKGLLKTVFLASDFQEFCSAKMTNFI